MVAFTSILFFTLIVLSKTNGNGAIQDEDGDEEVTAIASHVGRGRVFVDICVTACFTHISVPNKVISYLKAASKKLFLPEINLTSLSDETFFDTTILNWFCSAEKRTELCVLKCNDSSKRQEAVVGFSGAQGLICNQSSSENYYVCFRNAYKLTPSAFESGGKCLQLKNEIRQQYIHSQTSASNTTADIQLFKSFTIAICKYIACEYRNRATELVHQCGLEKIKTLKDFYQHLATTTKNYIFNLYGRNYTASEQFEFHRNCDNM